MDQKYVIKTVGCGTSHKYTNIQIYSVKYHKHFTKTVLQIIFTYNIFINAVKKCDYWYFIEAVLTFALSFLRIGTLGVELLKFYASIEGTFLKIKVVWYLVYEGDAYYFY